MYEFRWRVGEWCLYFFFINLWIRNEWIVFVLIKNFKAIFINRAFYFLWMDYPHSYYTLFILTIISIYNSHLHKKPLIFSISLIPILYSHIYYAISCSLITIY
jgi:hypothetical protein